MRHRAAMVPYEEAASMTTIHDGPIPEELTREIAVTVGDPPSAARSAELPINCEISSEPADRQVHHARGRGFWQLVMTPDSQPLH